MCRLLKPQIVIETGVAYGASSAYMLQALHINGRGTLYSIDLPNSFVPDSAAFVGAAVPARLRSRWKLNLGSSRRLLRHVLREVGGVDLFIHDSLHTYNH